VFESWYSLAIGGSLFLGMLLLIELGRMAGRRRAQQEGAGTRAGLGAIDAAVLSLLGLLVAFSFSGAAARFDARRHLAIDETNAIGTAWLRLDVLPADSRTDLREMFRQYLDARLRVARAMPDLQAAHKELRHCADLQDVIWKRSVAACSQSESPSTGMLLLPALNQMFDIASTRTGVAYIHPPMIIFVMLFLLALASGLLAGYGMSGARNRSWIHVFGLAAAVAAAVFVIVDLEYPRAGVIRLESSDHLLEDLRQTMEPTP